MSNKKYNSKTICLIKDHNLLINNKEFAKFEYEGGDSFETVKFILKENQSVRADAGAMNYMSSDIKIKTTTGSVMGALGRMFSGSSAFYNIFYNDTKIPREITFSGINPGSVGCFYIPKGKSFNLVSYSYLCSTPNLDISTNVRLGGFIMGYGLTFVDISAKNGSGLIWASSYGNTIEKIIEPGHSIKIDNGVLLGFEANININTRLIGGFTSTLFSGEGLVSEITNNDSVPMRIFLQSRSKIAYIDYIKNIAKKTKRNSGFKINIDM
jgi:uncharacterized protein (AIM24 family)